MLIGDIRNPYKDMPGSGYIKGKGREGKSANVILERKPGQEGSWILQSSTHHADKVDQETVAAMVGRLRELLPLIATEWEEVDLDTLYPRFQADHLIPRLTGDLGYRPPVARRIAERLAQASPRLKRAFWTWWIDGELDPSFAVEGYTLDHLIERDKHHRPMAAFSLLAQLESDPDQVRRLIERGHDAAIPRPGATRIPVMPLSKENAEDRALLSTTAQPHAQRGAAPTARALSDNPLTGNTGAVRRWAFVYDNDDDFGGGFVSGEFLLRSDGVLWRRMGGSRTAAGGTTYHYGPWRVDGRWKDGVDATACAAWLRGRRYGLYEPGPIGVSEREAGPFPGVPAPATPAAP